MANKTKIILAAILIFFSFIVVTSSCFVGLVFPKQIELIFFSNPNCRASEGIDKIIEEINTMFNGSIYVNKIIVKVYDNDGEDSPDVKLLRERYNVDGVPTIVINGKPLNKKYTKKNIINEICRQFILKPRACFKRG